MSSPVSGARRDTPPGVFVIRIGVDAMVTGIYGGDPKALSLKSAFPRMFELEDRYGGLFRAQLAIAREKVPQVTLVQMDLTGEWPSVLQQRFDRIVANFVLHEFDLATKVSLLRRLVTDHLVVHGRIVIGDVAFATAAARHESGAEAWDEDEFYWAADETAVACAGSDLAISFQPVSWCTGVFAFEAAPPI